MSERGVNAPYEKVGVDMPDGEYPPAHHVEHLQHALRKKRCTCERICCISAIVFTFVVLLIAGIGVGMYFLFKPQAPQYDIQQASMKNITLSLAPTATAPAVISNQSKALAPSAAATAPAPAPAPGPALGTILFYINGEVDLNITTRNPNKVDIKYDTFNVSVYYQQSFIGNATIPPFTQSPHSNKSVQTSLVFKDYPLSGQIGTSLFSQINTNSLPLEMDIYVVARVAILDIVSPSAKVSVQCFVSFNPQSGGLNSKDCHIQKVSIS